MRFIWNFFFFGILFYLIWLAFPETFMTLVSWANEVYLVLKDLVLGVADKVQHQLPSHQHAIEPVKTLFWH